MSTNEIMQSQNDKITEDFFLIIHPKQKRYTLMPLPQWH